MNKDKKIPFDPNTPYTINEAAAILGQTPDWIKRNAIKTGQLQFTPLGNQVAVMGCWIADYIVRNGTFEGDENCPASGRGKHKKSSPRTGTKGGESTS